MEIRFSEHLLVRLAMRGIPQNVPQDIVRTARRRFFDAQSHLEIAVAKKRLYGRMRDLAVTYRRESNYILLITIHPLKSGQLENRARSRRWIPIV